MPFSLGFWAAAGAGGGAAAGAYELISTTVLSSTSSSVSFTSIDTTTYKHLQVRVTVAANTAGVPGIFATFNSDSGTNYAYHWLQGYNGSVTSSSQFDKTFMFFGDMAGNAVANAFSANIIDILDAGSSTKFKTVRGLTGVQLGASNNSQIVLRSNLWRSTSAITSLTMTPTASSFAIGSRFSLYGIKG
jgi:hypothetical protein